MNTRQNAQLSLLILAITGTTSTYADDVQLDTVVVEADFRQTDVQQIPEAVTVVGSKQIEARSAEHLEQVLSFAPNVNFSSGASRGRYFQIRGIGERSQFVDPVNPSVGLMIDGIDMTGLGAAATLFDVQQVEVLRGPQGTRFGANALAGMINVRSNDPSKESEGYIKARAGNYDSYGLGGAVSGGLADNLQGRLAVQGFQSDGYLDNTYLNRDDTNKLDEIIARGKLAYQLNNDTDLGLTYLYADIDNGYDAFSLDKNRNTLSDQPGRDSQDTQAVALTVDSRLNNDVQLQAELTGSWNDSEYSYDEDWAYVGIAPDSEYSSFDQYLRDYQRTSADIRFLSGPTGRLINNSSDWVAGIYIMQRNEDLKRNYTYLSAPFTSSLESQAVAFYGELSSDISVSTRIISGLRFEHWGNDYQDNNGINGNTAEGLMGGKITIETLLSPSQMLYGSLARGYKAGGINTDPDISEDNREFDTEFNNTAEVGLKSSLLDDELTTRIAAFYIQRKNQQVKSSYAIQNDDNSLTFQDYLANAAEGRNYGVELESDWNITPSLNWAVSYGYLKTEFIDYQYQTDDGEVNKDGRAQAHAPENSLATSLTTQLLNGLSLRIESEAKDTFYFSDSHDEKSKAYVLWHARLAYDSNNYAAALYGRNLTNRDYEVRGFGGFGNDPRNGYANDRYVQYGEPRLVGIEGTYRF
ncbi:TonB-dependent receptor [Thalassolituus oleivorans]|uniref:TonB-dependent receptor n=1 Tax=Thalassolituus oleivorans TaxID=187493 RepID=UPI00042DCD1A|nr:TonB-dependent receptor plug domain-containing protein [Thalassolituus oleivorans]AHK14644.1 TonB-denpendent receptor [Thalassolituus oleivorans R6-15]